MVVLEKELLLWAEGRGKRGASRKVLVVCEVKVTYLALKEDIGPERFNVYL